MRWRGRRWNRPDRRWHHVGNVGDPSHVSVSPPSRPVPLLAASATPPTTRPNDSASLLRPARASGARERWVHAQAVEEGIDTPLAHPPSPLPAQLESGHRAGLPARIVPAPRARATASPSDAWLSPHPAGREPARSHFHTPIAVDGISTEPYTPREARAVMGTVFAQQARCVHECGHPSAPLIALSLREHHPLLLGLPPAKLRKKSVLRRKRRRQV
jgi:hypothetical protein